MSARTQLNEKGLFVKKIFEVTTALEGNTVHAACFLIRIA